MFQRAGLGAVRRLALPLAVVMFLALSVSAHNEVEAPLLRPDVAAAGHTPFVVAAHTQWSGFLTLRPASNVTSASYQICRVGSSCFAPPAPALRDGDTFRFNTSEYVANGKAIDYQAGWRIGVQWILVEGPAIGNATAHVAVFPDGPSADDAACTGAAALGCQESHYLAFDIPASPRQSPGSEAPAVLVFVAASALVAGRRRDRQR